MIDWLLAAAYFFHLVATIVWLGGLVLISMLVWPEARKILGNTQQGAEILNLLDKIRQRFYPLANLSLVVLIVTGLYQMDRNKHYDGLLQFTNEWTRVILLKHIAVLGMLGVGILMQWGVLPALERATLLARRGKDSPDLDRLRRRERQLVLINTVLGIVVLFFTALATAI